MSTTRINLYRELAERLYLGELDVVTGTATASTTATSLRDTARLKYTSADASAYDRVFVYAMEAADASTRGFGRIDEGAAAATGIFTISGGTMSGFVADDPYVLTRHHPDVLHAALDAVLRNMYVPCLFPLSMHIVQNDCNDMEASTVATDWELTTGGAAAALETSIVFNGGQSLQLTDNAGNEYAALKAQVGVHENTSLCAAVMCYVTSGDAAAFRIWDVTNDAEIDSATTDEPSWTELVFSFSTPSGCEQIDARLECITSGDITYWDDFQIWYNGSGVYPGPSWLTKPSQMIDVRAFSRGTGGPASDNDYRTNERASAPLDWHIERENLRGDNPLHLWVQGTSSRPYICALRPFAELATDAATTTADKDRVVDWAARLIREPDKASETLGLLRASQLSKPVSEYPRRVGVRID